MATNTVVDTLQSSDQLPRDGDLICFLFFLS